jgi:hypothetical protein
MRQAKVALLRASGGVALESVWPIGGRRGMFRLGDMCAVPYTVLVLGGSVGALDGSTVRHRQTDRRAGKAGRERAEGREAEAYRRERADSRCYTATLVSRNPALKAEISVTSIPASQTFVNVSSNDCSLAPLKRCYRYNRDIFLYHLSIRDLTEKYSA